MIEFLIFSHNFKFLNYICVNIFNLNLKYLKERIVLFKSCSRIACFIAEVFKLFSVCDPLSGPTIEKKIFSGLAPNVNNLQLRDRP